MRFTCLRFFRYYRAGEKHLQFHEQQQQQQQQHSLILPHNVTKLNVDKRFVISLVMRDSDAAAAAKTSSVAFDSTNFFHT
jgi:hypothetical protein